MISINVGRKTIFGNPSKQGVRCPVCLLTHETIEPVLACYRRYLYYRLTDEFQIQGQEIARQVWPPMPGIELSAAEYRDEVLALHGKILKCPGCGINHPKCHARWLEKAILWLQTQTEPGH